MPDPEVPGARALRRDRIEAVETAPELGRVRADVKGHMRDLYLTALLVAGDRPVVSHGDLNEAAGLLETHHPVVEAIDGDDDRFMVRLVPGSRP